MNWVEAGALFRCCCSLPGDLLDRVECTMGVVAQRCTLEYRAEIISGILDSKDTLSLYESRIGLLVLPDYFNKELMNGDGKFSQWETIIAGEEQIAALAILAHPFDWDRWRFAGTNIPISCVIDCFPGTPWVRWLEYTQSAPVSLVIMISCSGG